MTQKLRWMIDVDLDPTKTSETASVRDDLLASSKSEDGVLSYEWYVAEDGNSAVIHEEFAGDEAMLAHIDAFGAFAERFMACCTITRFAMLGKAGAEANEAVSNFGAAMFSDHIGFSR